MQTVIPLEPGVYYHIYNRGVNRSDIFIEDRNYAYFMQLYAKYIVPVAATFAYCLMRNHFHLLVRVRTDRLGLGDRVGLDPVPLNHRAVSHAFNKLLSAYARAVNKSAGRTGSLFQHHFGRVPVTSDRYFLVLIHYIHNNPQKHGFVKDFREWPYSSYRALVSDKPTKLERDIVLGWFGGTQALERFHTQLADESTISPFIGDDER